MVCTRRNLGISASERGLTQGNDPTAFIMSALVINRLHYRVLDRLKDERGLVFSWAHEAAEADPLLTHILGSHYNTPKRTRGDSTMVNGAACNAPMLGLD